MSGNPTNQDLNAEKELPQLVEHVTAQACGIEDKCYVRSNCQNAKSFAYGRRDLPCSRCGLAAKEKYKHRYRYDSKHSDYATIFAVGMNGDERQEQRKRNHQERN